uniref:Putative secreted protein n=1 Tax=Anopheles darlingi TaxID=43151 RepID=A0A2M4DH84_ANODA
MLFFTVNCPGFHCTFRLLLLSALLLLLRYPEVSTLGSAPFYRPTVVAWSRMGPQSSPSSFPHFHVQHKMLILRWWWWH